MQTLSFPSNTSFQLVKPLLRMLKDLYQEGTAYKKAGVIVSEIVPSFNANLNFLMRRNTKTHGGYGCGSSENR